MKKIIALLLALMMVLALCACGGGGTATNTPAPEQQAENTPTPEPTPEPQEDLIAIESIILTPITNADQTEIQVKIRNLTDEKKDRIGIYLQALDENGDVITDCDYVCVKNLQAGQAGTSSEGFRLYCPYDEISAIRVYSYNFGIKSEQYVGAFEIVEEIDLVEPITFTMSEIDSNSGIDVYIWMGTT